MSRLQAWLRHGVDGRVRLHHKALVIGLDLARFGVWIVVEFIPGELRIAARRRALERERALVNWRLAQLPRRQRREAERILRRTRRRYPWTAGAYASIASPTGMGNDGQRAYDMGTRTWFGSLVGSLVSTLGKPWYDVTAPTFAGGATGNGITDDGAAEASAASHAANDGGGLVYWPRTPNSYFSNSTLAINTPTVGIKGDGSLLSKLTYGGSGDRVRIQCNPFSASSEGGFYGGLNIDVSAGGAGATCFHYGDIVGGTIDDLRLQGATGAGSKGAWIDNRADWTERLIVHRMWVNANKIGVLWDVNGGMTSHGYQNWDYLVINTNDGQVGIQSQNAAAVYHGQLTLRGNISETGSGADVWIMQDTSQFGSSNFSSLFDVAVEQNGGAPRGLTMNATSQMSGAGTIDFAAMPCSKATGAAIFFSGLFNCPGILPNIAPLTAIGSGGLNLILDNPTPSATTRRTRIDFMSAEVRQYLLLVDRNGAGVQDFGLFDSLAGVIRWFTDTDGSFHLTNNGHFVVSSAAIGATSNLGANVTSATVTGNDVRGKIVIVMAGALAANTRICTVTWANAWGVAPIPLLVSETSGAGLVIVNFYSGAEGTTTFDLFCEQALAAGTYQVRYICIG